MAHVQIPPPELVPFGMRALKCVAMADGSFAEPERALLEAAQQLFRVSVDLEALAPITPAELAGAVEDPALRLQLVRAMLMVSLVDGEASPAEAAQVRAFADALGIGAEELRTFEKISEGHLLTARFEVLRRFWAVPHVRARVEKEGLPWLAKTLAAFVGLRENTALAERYRKLQEYPSHTLGHAYFRFVRDNGFSLPGEKGSPPEPIILHDLTHVLSGYGTDPTGEICVTAFHAGYRQQNPFTFILFSMMQFNLGIRMVPIAAAAKQQVDPARWLQAAHRGSQMTRDITDGTWDWWENLPRDIEEVRAELGIPPLATG